MHECTLNVDHKTDANRNCDVLFVSDFAIQLHSQLEKRDSKIMITILLVVCFNHCTVEIINTEYILHFERDAQARTGTATASWWRTPPS